MTIPVSELEELRTPLGLASLHGDVEEVMRLLREGASLDEQDVYRESALHAAAWGGHLELVRVLVKEYRVPVDMPNWEGWTPLVIALSQSHLAVADFLANSGANPNWTTQTTGWQPVHVASWLNDAAALQWVLRRGQPRLEKETRHGATPMVLARPGQAKRDLCAALATKTAQSQAAGSARSESSYQAF